MKTKAFAAVIVACAMLVPLVGVGAANAATYTLVNIHCTTEDCSMAGTFDYNGLFSNIDITMTGSVFPGRVFNADKGSSSTQLFAGDNNDDYFVWNFGQPLLTNGGNVAVVSGCGFSTQGSAAPDNCTQLFLPNFGLTGSVQAPVSATPLPTTLPFFATGLGALGLLGWRRKLKAAAIAA